MTLHVVTNSGPPEYPGYHGSDNMKIKEIVRKVICVICTY